MKERLLDYGSAEPLELLDSIFNGLALVDNVSERSVEIAALEIKLGVEAGVKPGVGLNAVAARSAVEKSGASHRGNIAKSNQDAAVEVEIGASLNNDVAFDIRFFPDRLHHAVIVRHRAFIQGIDIELLDAAEIDRGDSESESRADVGQFVSERDLHSLANKRDGPEPSGHATVR